LLCEVESVIFFNTEAKILGHQDILLSKPNSQGPSYSLKALSSSPTFSLNIRRR
jgi:hypothetical protein